MKKVLKEVEKKPVKKAKKAFKPEFTVDITECATGLDVKRAIIEAKIHAGITATEQEVDILTDCFVNDVLDALMGTKNALVRTKSGDVIALDAVKVNEDLCICKKKPNVFKRFWNWITRKNA